MSSTEEWLLKNFNLSGVQKISSSGINSELFLCKGQSIFIAKKFANDKESLDRLNREKCFLSFSNTVSPGFTPKLYEVHEEKSLILMEYFSGSPYKETKNITNHELGRTLEFLSLLNQNKSIGKIQIPNKAKDSFEKIDTYFELINNRISCFTLNHLKKYNVKDIESCHKLLTSTWNRVKKLTFNIENNNTSNYCEQIISPSDFGFHNAIKTTSGVVFIDFEYSGWDDPAKLVIDFFLQPGIPIPKTWIPQVIGKIEKISSVPNIVERVRILTPLFKIKWACIILNFLEERKFNRFLEFKHFDNIADEINNRVGLVANYLKWEKIFDLR